MEPTVSVVIPTFNRSRLVVGAVDSALRQTVGGLEVIVVDDGSTDDTADRLRTYRDRIRYVYQENRGASAAQNKGIALARAPWIAVLASDDVWLPTKLEAQLHAIDALGGDYGACFTDCVYAGDSTMSLSAFGAAGLECPAPFAPLDHPLTYVLGRHPALYVQSMLVSRAALGRAGRFDEELLVGEDTDLLFRLSFHTRFCVVRDALVRIDRGPSPSGRLSDLFKRGDDVMFQCTERRIQKWLVAPEVTDPALRAVLQRSLQGLYYRWAIARLSDRRLGEALKMIRLAHSSGRPLAALAAALMVGAIRRLLLVRGTRRRRRNRSADAPGAQAR
jgi:glycosyltransferase involved in cell wall biosynthesis